MKTDIPRGKNIILYGGAGWLGEQLVGSLIEKGANAIVVYSRDESKHHKLEKKYPGVECVVGDVADRERVIKFTEHCNISINLAAIKQIHVAQKYPDQAMKTIVDGAMNTKEAAIKHELEHACLISSDKACAPSNVYGCAKAIAESIYVDNNTVKSWRDDVDVYDTTFSVCRYGNVAGSVNSILYNLPEFVKKRFTISLFHKNMTRFTITAQEAIALIYHSIDSGRSEIVIPKLKSYRVEDLFQIYHDNFGLNWTMAHPRTGEKLHELLFSKEEFPKIWKPIIPHTPMPVYHISNNYNNYKETAQDFSSEDHCYTKEALEQFLITNNYFRNE